MVVDTKISLFRLQSVAKKIADDDDKHVLAANFGDGEKRGFMLIIGAVYNSHLVDCCEFLVVVNSQKVQ